MQTTLFPQDLARVRDALPQDIRTLLVERGARLFLAGGFIRSTIEGEAPNDIDLFAPSPAEAESLAKHLSRGGALLETGNAYTIRRDPAVQVIHRWTFATPQEVIAGFDFTIAQAIVWVDEDGQWQSLCASAFYDDLQEKVLRYTSPDLSANAGGSILRAFKFARRGYHLPLEDLAVLIARIAREAEQTGDSDLTRAVTTLLHEVDPAAPPEWITGEALVGSTPPRRSLRDLAPPLLDDDGDLPF